MKFPLLYSKNGVGFLTENNQEFASVYLKARDLEHRILSDEEVKLLPYRAQGKPHSEEWNLRRKSFQRIMTYLRKKPPGIHVLDLGCGNGWFANAMASISAKNQILGLDINVLELEQAARVFQKSNLQFVYGDVLQLGSHFVKKFQIITLNASLQYFKSAGTIIAHLRSFLTPGGEIHIIDSPFYKAKDISKAQKRTKDYYENLEVPEMIRNYFHHCLDEIGNHRILYRPLPKIFRSLGGPKDSPFLWIVLYEKD